MTASTLNCEEITHIIPLDDEEDMVFNKLPNQIHQLYKQRPLLKHKAKLNAHGGIQVYGENYWDTYTPVVNLIRICMMLRLSIIHNLYMTSINFTLAFPQADVETTIYMEVPLGCEVTEIDCICLLLIKLYDFKQAAKTWFKCLRDNLIASGENGGYRFRESEIDPCIFYKGVLLILWVDDCLIFAKQKEITDQLITDLNRNFFLTMKKMTCLRT